MGGDDFADAMGYGSFIWARDEPAEEELTAEQVLRARRAVSGAVDRMYEELWRRATEPPPPPPPCPLVVETRRNECRMVLEVALRCERCGFGSTAVITDMELVDRVDVTPMELALRAGVEPCDRAMRELERRTRNGGPGGWP